MTTTKKDLKDKMLDKKKPCKECPWVVRNKHNDTIVKFSKEKNKNHNCHMTEGSKNLWKVNSKTECVGCKLNTNYGK